LTLNMIRGIVSQRTTSSEMANSGLTLALNPPQNLLNCPRAWFTSSFNVGSDVVTGPVTIGEEDEGASLGFSSGGTGVRGLPNSNS
jgi:hypothetical protein